jgi:hypothetical protein
MADDDVCTVHGKSGWPDSGKRKIKAPKNRTTSKEI